MRQKAPPYDILDDRQRYAIFNAMFDKIALSDCNLISVTIDKENHCRTYNHPINPLAYALYILQERFQYFLEDVDDTGTVIYEQYNSRLRKMVERVMTWLTVNTSFSVRTQFNRIAGVINGRSLRRTNTAIC